MPRAAECKAADLLFVFPNCRVSCLGWYREEWEEVSR